MLFSLVGFHRPLSLQRQPGVPSAEQAQAVGETVSACPAPLWRWGRGSARGKKQRFPGCLGDRGVLWALGALFFLVQRLWLG